MEPNDTIAEMIRLHLAKAIKEGLDDNFTSPNVADQNMEPANMVDVIQFVGQGMYQLARCVAIEPNATCLTDSINGVRYGLCEIAGAINRLAEAIEKK